MRCMEEQPEGPIRLRWYFLSLVALWTAAVSVVLGWDLCDEHRQVLAIARGEARGLYENDILFRRWVAGHGGVYVPATKETPPNRYLEGVPERDITTPSGRRLTLVNPAYMTRQVHVMAEEQFGVHGHITSLDTLNPENAPDAWEVEALKQLQKGGSEVSSLEKLEGEWYMRLMRPMAMESSCLKCHADRGYQIGQVRGGISVSVPMAPHWAAHGPDVFHRAIGYSALWVCGLAGILSIGRRLRRQVDRRFRAEEELHAARRELEDRVNVRTAALTEANQRLQQEIAVRERVEEASRQLAAIVTSSDDAIISTTLDGRITSWNKGAERLFGFSAAEKIGESLAGMGSDGCSRQIGDLLRQVAEGKAVRIHDAIRRRKDGSEVHISLSVSPVRGASGEVVGASAIARDITDRQRIEAEAQAAQDRLLEFEHREKERAQAELERLRAQVVRQTQLATIGQLSASIAHELRNPLGVIRNAAYLLKRKISPEETKLQHYVTIVEEETSTADQIITELMAMTRGQAPRKEPVELCRLVRDALARLSVPEEVRWHSECHPDPFVVQADPAQLVQVIRNLFINSIQAMEGSGEITVQTARDDRFDQITIRDTGPGVPAEARQYVFEPLFTTKTKGTGLGLAICRQIVERHGGSLEMLDTKEGAAFHIRLPHAAAKGPSAAGPEPLAAASSQP